MKPNEFSTQMDRLESRWKNVYVDELRKLIWSEFSNLTDGVLTRMTNRFIGEMRQPPLMLDFREAAAREREQIWNQRKREEYDFAENIDRAFSPEDSSMIAQAICKRILGNLSDDSWESVMRILGSLSKTATRARCSRCHDNGAIFARIKGQVGDYAFRCDCPAGNANRSAYAKWNSYILKNFEVCG